MNELHSSILGALPPSGSEPRERLWTRTMRAMRSSIPREEYEAALEELQRAREVALEASYVRRTSPDFPERQLEAPIQDWLFGDEIFEKLKFHRDRTICQKTAVGGRAGSGLWSRPDFTIATIRRRKYDPIRHLDVVAFELKNLAGANVVAVHEALAHTRFAHYAYLVCPRSSAHEDRYAGIHAACSAHGIGLLSFRIEVNEGDKPLLKDKRLDIAATRREPDPDIVGQFLDDRLSQANCARLANIAEKA